MYFSLFQDWMRTDNHIRETTGRSCEGLPTVFAGSKFIKRPFLILKPQPRRETTGRSCEGLPTDVSGLYNGVCPYLPSSFAWTGSLGQSAAVVSSFVARWASPVAMT